MFIQQISFQLPTDFDWDKVENEFIALVVAYRNNGQIQDEIDQLYITAENKAVSSFITIAKNALNKKFNSKHVTARTKTIEETYSTKIEYKLLGEALIHQMEQCTCKQSAFYILYTNFLAKGSPITCGSCFNDVPLYKLPLYDEYGYQPILLWESNYKACDTLNMNCEVGEMWAMKQMWNVNSKLSKQGIEICKKISALTNTPTYYYLYNYRKISRAKDSERKCPCCGGEWLLKEQLHNLFDFKCDTCNLISSISPNY